MQVVSRLIRIKYTVIFSLLMFGVVNEGFAFSFPTNHSLLNRPQINDSNALYFKFDNANFLWNNEYFNDYYPGYTLIGFFVTPQLQYHFTPNLQVDGGVHLLKYSGIDNFTQCLPAFSVTYKKNNSKLILGSLQGTIAHKVSDVLLFNELYFTQNMETGMQYLLNKPWLWMDLWVDWQTFIFPYDNKQEEILAGLNLIPVIYNGKHNKLEGSATLIAYHQGGQIDTVEAPLKTLLNYGLSLKYSHNINSKWIEQLSFESQFVGFNDNSPTKLSLYNSGFGLMNNIRFSNRFGYMQVGYFSADKFLSIRGNPMFQCYSTVDPMFHKTEQSIITANLFYSKEIFKGCYLGLMGDVYYNTNDKQTDYSMGLTLIINHDFFIGRFKNTESK